VEINKEWGAKRISLCNRKKAEKERWERITIKILMDIDRKKGIREVRKVSRTKKKSAILANL